MEDYTMYNNFYINEKYILIKYCNGCFIDSIPDV